MECDFERIESKNFNVSIDDVRFDVECLSCQSNVEDFT